MHSEVQRIAMAGTEPGGSSGPGPDGVPAQEAAVRYQIDPAMSRLTIKVSAAGLFAGFGHNPTIAIRGCSGEASFVPVSFNRAKVHITVHPDSCEVTDDVSQKDKLEIESRMKQEVLETSRYPAVDFQSASVMPIRMGDQQYAARIAGSLTLHGITRSLEISCQVSLTGETLRAFGEFPVRQTDYGIKLVSVAGGTLKVKDEVKCAFEILARKAS